MFPNDCDNLRFYNMIAMAVDYYFENYTENFILIKGFYGEISADFASDFVDIYDFLPNRVRGPVFLKPTGII